MPTPDESREPAGLVRRLRDGYPAAGPPEEGSRLGRMVTRLTVALEAAEAERGGPLAIRDDLIALVPRLRRYAASLTADPAEADDLVQATLLKAWTQRERLRLGPALVAWLFAALRADATRAPRRTGSPPPVRAEPGLDRAGSGTERRAVRAALDRLTLFQREALLLVTVEGLPRAVVAAILGRAPEAIAEAVDGAHARLARDLGPS